MKKQILNEKYYVLNDGGSLVDLKYSLAYLLCNFGIEISNPEKLTAGAIAQIEKFMHLRVPHSFYTNPQDTKLFRCSELLLEQLISYISISLEGTHNPDANFNRIELFKKVIPDYIVGNEVKTRLFTVVDEEEAEKIIQEYFDNLCNYTRPFNVDETERFNKLFKECYHGQKISCKDNIFNVVEEHNELASQLDKKDVVKYSIYRYGEFASFNISAGDIRIFTLLVNNAKNCPMSKKQAKYFNTITKKLNIACKDETNSDSPYKKATELMKAGKPLDAAKIFASNGSLLERNLVWILSRCNPREAIEVLDLLDSKNPIVLTQLMRKIKSAKGDVRRSFKFYNNKKVRNHIETQYERTWRKSKLNDSTIKLVEDELSKKLEEYYSNLPKIGKVYIEDDFKNIGIPTNTSASGVGLDVLPLGSRIKIKGDYIRTFCHWTNVFDIDASAIFYKNSNEFSELSWRTGAMKPFGDSALTSGDCRDKNGAEYQDFNIQECLDLGYRYVFYYLNGYGGKLDIGSIFCGYQDKKNLETTAWDPKNIEFQINVKGDSREYVGFCIDLEAREIIVLNQVLDSNSLVGSKNYLQMYEDVIDPNYIKFNMYKIISLMADEIVCDPKDADYVFSNTYVKNQELEKEQKIIKIGDTDSLVSLINR